MATGKAALTDKDDCLDNVNRVGCGSRDEACQRAAGEVRGQRVTPPRVLQHDALDLVIRSTLHRRKSGHSIPLAGFDVAISVWSQACLLSPAYLAGGHQRSPCHACTGHQERRVSACACACDPVLSSSAVGSHTWHSTSPQTDDSLLGNDVTHDGNAAAVHVAFCLQSGLQLERQVEASFNSTVPNR